MYCETHNTSSTDYITVEMMSAQCVGYVREPSVQTWTQVWTPSPAEGTKVLGPGLWIATQSKSNWYCFDQEADGIYVKIYRKHYKYQAGTHTKILLYEGDYITEMWPICYEK